MDIEKLIEQLSARGLSNGSSLGYHSGLFDDAATALSTLQAENERLRTELEQVERERDEAVHDRMMMEQRVGELSARATAADVAEVVRCRECKRSVVHNGELFCLYAQDVTPPDGYCYRGEADFIRRQQHDL